ncbi:GRB10-interacting GYF protein 2 isoform X6 [Oncorhynchus mykiss]|uniref:GRB10-interacting GYF protein 2 isoform X6 n=1 Tax=Oncorhynchus mykiss TaxID=8022 RepID=UPI001878A527|nr:GRB10-interacting GYF protein 2 isoform X6 [Oncorhynchus mykiss]XP_036841691.1 GRB10-interacting GYF protein 2 isoform X6 [Oncorhynchus mykiss]
MAETQTLNFGPEWLRALSGGGHGGGSSSSVATSPPLSPALPKYKLADYRYGREEMLALYVKDREIPVDLHDKDFLPILQEEPLPPLALVAFTEEEQRNFSMSVNSAAVLRLMGRGGGPVGPGAPRGRSTSRGRGRGRGDGGFYQRSFDDVEGGFGRGGREMHRSQSWEESHAESIFSPSRGDRRFEKPGRKESEVAPAHFPMNHIRANYEDVGTGVGGLPVRKHDFTRSESENWRTSRDEANGEDGDEGGWRLAGASRRDSDRWCPPSPDGLRSAVRREVHPGEQPRQRRFPFDAREDERGYRRPRSGSGSLEEDGSSLPEWCLEDAEEETGTFDSSGAFLSLKVRKAPKEPILEEAELDFRPLEECDEGLEEDGQPRETKNPDREARRDPDRKQDVGRGVVEAPPAPSPPEPQPSAPLLPPSQPDRAEEPERPLERPPAPEHRPEANKVPLNVPMSMPMSNTMLDSLPIPHTAAHTLTVSPVSAPSSTIQMQQKPPDVPVAMPVPLPFSTSLMAQSTSIMTPNIMAPSTGLMAPIGRPTVMPPHHTMVEDERLKHFEQEAEKMVAYLQDSDDRLAAKNSAPEPAGLPLTHEAALKWFYKDPQGEMQGPFSNPEMTEWFQAGYFTMTLLVKRGCDEVFQPLGEIIKMWGRVPFAPGPAPPPLLGDAGDQERLKLQQELTALNLYQLQQLQYQYLLRQQYAQALAQQKAQALSSAPHQQQQQQQQQINLLLQQYQALKMRSAEHTTSESLLTPVTRSMSVPESQGSVWEMQHPSQVSCTPNIQQPAPSAWEGSSVWDLPIDSMAQAPTIEQMQQLEKNKAAKVSPPHLLEMERCEAELRAKREEEEKERKRLEEALRSRQEAERKRLEEELSRHKQEEELRQREQEEAQRRQKEEEERQAQEEALRRLEERRREEEERQQREEFLHKQEEERRKQEEEHREEERRKQEEERREEERRKQEEERRKQEELEALRRCEEEKRLEEEAVAAAMALARQQQEEAKRREQEAARQQELARQRQQQQEALRRLQQQQQQQQLAQMKLPSSSKWGQQSAVTAAAISQSQNALSLSEIQKVEEERERQAREEQRRQQAELLKLQQQQALQEALQPQAKLSGWGSVAKQPAATKSLLEIQREEAQQVKQRKEQGGGSQQPSHPTVTQPNRSQNRATTALSSSVWGSVATSSMGGGAPNWGGESSSIWGDSTNSNMGFWDETAQPPPQAPPPARKPNAQKNNKANANLSSRANKKVEEEEKLLKLFQGVNKSQQDGFMQWCEQTLHTLNTANNLDVPTFASFLKEVDSPYEVHDYVRAYLGDTSEAKEFAKQFLERRAKQKANQQKEPQAPQNQQPTLKQRQQQQDSVWGGTGSPSRYQSNHTSLQQQARFETVTSGKKKKKQKMVRADPSLLGFSVNAASERLNMGEIETVEDF